MPSLLEWREMRETKKYDHREFNRSPASSFSLLGGSRSFVVWHQQGSQGYTALMSGEQQATHESCLCGPICGLETSNWKHFEARTSLFIVVFFHLRIAELQLLLEAFAEQNI